MQSNDHKVKLLNHTNKDLKEGDLFKNHMESPQSHGGSYIYLQTQQDNPN